MSRNGGPGDNGGSQDNLELPGGNGHSGHNGHNDAVRTEILLSHGLLPVGQAGVFWALVTLTGIRPKAEVEAGAEGGAEAGAKEGSEVQKERLPLNISLVLDRSGSMTGDPLEHVKEAACFVVDQLSAKDRFSLVTFDTEVDVLCPSQEVQYKDALKARVRGIQSGSSTNLSGGLLRGYEEVRKENRAGQVNRLVLLSDGMANVGITSPAALRAKTRSIAEKGISVSTVGVGSQFDEDLMINMAEGGHGNFYYVKNMDEIPRVFEQELMGLLSVVAQAITVEVNAMSGCRLVGVLGYEPQPTPDGAVLNLPDMYENDTKRLVLEIAHPPLPEGEHEVLGVTVDYTDATQALAAVSVSVRTRLNAGYGPAEAYKPNYEVMKRVELVRTALAKDEVVERNEEGDLEEGKQVLESRITALEELAREHGAEDPEVREEIRSLKGLVQQVEEVRTVRESHAGFVTSSSAFQTLPDSQLEQELRKQLRNQSYQTRRTMPPQPDKQAEPPQAPQQAAQPPESSGPSQPSRPSRP
ncbi:MAG: vWA domain-containing protein [Bacteroidota bacterium]